MDFKYDAFPVDDTVNGIRNTEKIKIMICYMLDTIKTPITRDDIQSILYDNGIANYFEVCQAVDNLLMVNALDCKNDENAKKVFTVNDKGRQIAKALQSELSVYIKNKTINVAMKTLLYNRRQQENEVEIVKIEDGRYRLDITMHSMMNNAGKDDKLLKMSLYVTDSLQAEAMKASFFNNPVRLYDSVINGLTNDAVFMETYTDGEK